MKRLSPLSCLFALGLALSSPGRAQPAADNGQTVDNAPAVSAEEALVIDGRSYAKRYGVSLEEAMRRILVMAGTGEEVASLDSEFGDQVAGVYFDHGASFGLKVRLTGQERRADRRLRRAPLPARDAGNSADRRAVREKLRISPAEAETAAAVLRTEVSAPVEFLPGGRKGRRAARSSVQTNFDRIAGLIPALSGVAYDERRGAVVVQVIGDPSAVATAARTSIQALFDVPVEYESIARPLTPRAVRGGTALTYSDRTLACTTAFMGYDASNRPGVFTAAHCWRIPQRNLFYLDWDERHHQFIIDTSLALYTTKEDILFLRFPAGLTGLPDFRANFSEYRTLTGRRTLTNTTATVTDSTAQGTWVCYFGQVTGPTHGQGCGEVKYKQFAASTSGSSGAMTVSSGPSYYVQVQGPSSGLRCQSGDSGAPWFIYTTAFGIMSSCGENLVNGTDSAANYTSMDAAYARSYRLAY